VINYASYGFAYTGMCRCDGTQTEKYKKDNYTIKHRRRQGTYRIKKNGVTVTQWMNEEQAENYIKYEICGHLKSVG
jgi:hypothetical protein